MNATLTETNAITLDDCGGTFLDWLVCAVLSLLACGLAYPAITTLAGGMLFPHQATGSLIEREGKVVGSALVAQPFVSDRYFHPRLSAAGYDVFALAGSNWASSNPNLRERLAETSAAIAAREGVALDAIPVDLVTASGSGIDPHLSPEAVRVQAARVARARGMTPADVEAVVARSIEGPTLGVLGRPRVNVFALNLALDELPIASRNGAVAR